MMYAACFWASCVLETFGATGLVVAAMSAECDGKTRAAASVRLRAGAFSSRPARDGVVVRPVALGVTEASRGARCTAAATLSTSFGTTPGA
jgi:hypothetical protein